MNDKPVKVIVLSLVYSTLPKTFTKLWTSKGQRLDSKRTESE